MSSTYRSLEPSGEPYQWQEKYSSGGGRRKWMVRISSPFCHSSPTFIRSRGRSVLFSLSLPLAWAWALLFRTITKIQTIPQAQVLVLVQVRTTARSLTRRTQMTPARSSRTHGFTKSFMGSHIPLLVHSYPTVAIRSVGRPFFHHFLRLTGVAGDVITDIQVRGGCVWLREGRLCTNIFGSSCHNSPP
jgi:hypothetical protein